MIRDKIAPGEYLHIYNRGVNKENIFINERDRIRFLFTILYFQSPVIFTNLGREVTYFVKHRMFNINKDDVENIHKNRNVELISFALMPNHFHLLVAEIKEHGISNYMQRIQNSYTKYFNTKYKKSGHLLQGSYKSVHIENNEQLLYLSAYIHRNPTEIKQWNKKSQLYPWSSYYDYVFENRWNNLLNRNIILSQFKNSKEYNDSIETSGAKSLTKNKLIDC